MRISVAELMNTFSDFELRHWRLLDSQEPMGDHGAYSRNSSFMAMYANAHIDPKKTKPFESDAFMPYRKAEKAVDPKANAKAFRAALFDAFGGRMKPAKEADVKPDTKGKPADA